MKGLQRYKCKGCGCSYTKSGRQGYSLEVKQEAVKYYLEGIGFRRIERLLGINYVTVYYWVRELGCEIKEEYTREQDKRVNVLEFDELCTYVKKTKYDLGLEMRFVRYQKNNWHRQRG
jgi:transposase-like protein